MSMVFGKEFVSNRTFFPGFVIFSQCFEAKRPADMCISVFWITEQYLRKIAKGIIIFFGFIQAVTHAVISVAFIRVQGDNLLVIIHSTFKTVHILEVFP